MQVTQVQSLGREDPLEEKMATHSSILAREIPWTEEPGGQSVGLQRVKHNLATEQQQQYDKQGLIGVLAGQASQNTTFEFL